MLKTPWFTLHFTKNDEDTSDDGNYYGYFQTAQGQHLTLVYHEQSQRGTLWVGDGDIKLHEEYDVIEGIAVGVTLEDIEAQWLRACWHAATT